MNCRTFLTFIIVLTSGVSVASEFKFNNKNLNSLGALVCQLDQGASSNSEMIRTHSLNVNQKRIGPKTTDVIVEVQGTCNKLIDSESMKVEALGDEFYLKIDRSQKLIGSGKLGIKNITIEFQKNKINRISIEDPLLLLTVTEDLSQSNWASSNQIFSFNNENMSLKFARKIAATEAGGTLSFNSTRFFNVWSDQAYGCSLATKEISDLTCEKLTKI